MKSITRLLVLTAATAGLASCGEKPIEPPSNVGICWHALPQKDGTINFNELSKNVPNLETCAATLEGMRLRFRSLGGSEQVVGSYQGQFLFLDSRGVQSAQTLTGVRYTALVPTGDGRLAVPGVIPR